MSVKKFKFVSPGVFVDEIDRSQLPSTTDRRGPLVIGRSMRGPAMRPVRVQSFGDFVEIFGTPVPGGKGGDIWRDGNYSSTTYAAYAAQAYLRNNAPINFVRLLGSKHGDVTAGVTAATPGWLVPDHAVADGGGAYGLFLFDSGSSSRLAAAPVVTGTLAAIWYAKNENTVIALSGNYAHSSSHATAALGALIQCSAASREFKASIYKSDALVESVTFNFDRSSEKFIRKVFNTNPTLTNTLIAANQQKDYWLGETFEGVLDAVGNGSGGPLTAASGSSATGTHGVVLALQTNAGSAIKGNLFKADSSVSKTGWVIAQDLGSPTSFTVANAQKLFRFITLETGEWDSKNLKISIQDLKFSNNEIQPFGTFTVLIRQANDSDSALRVLERFEGLSLDPNSLSYISRVIGDKHVLWNEKDRRLRDYGTYVNNSRFIRVEVSTEVEAGGDARWLPVGFFGPPSLKSFSLTSGSSPQTFGHAPGVADNADTDAMALIATSTKMIASGTWQGQTQRLVTTTPNDDAGAGTGVDYWTGDVVFPKFNLRNSSADTTLGSSTKAYFGIEFRRSANGKLHDETYFDLVRSKPTGIDSHVADARTTNGFIFTLDDLSASAGFNYSIGTKTDVDYVPGSRLANTSITAVGLSGSKLDVTANLAGLLDNGYDKFTMPLFGGSDGFDVTEREPLGNHLVGTNDKTSFVFNTYKRAIDLLQDTENLDCNAAAVPGLINSTLTSRLINNCEERGDVLAIIDLDSDYTPIFEVASDTSEADRVGSVDTAVSRLRNRDINSSYGCAYYPWVLVKDTVTSGQTIWMPPSVVALGVLGFSEAVGELWFAPAGFNRGGLSDGHAGLTVVGVRQKLSSKDRDKLYEQHINPIASFPAEGIVVFGQKTLQLTPSALDRINVRRLMIFLKKEISFAASRILFDQNVRATWNRFTGTVRPFLSDVKSRFGLTDYKLVLDETTTTEEMIDRNVLYAKIFVKPARAIEYIALDFVITATGASFEE